MTLKPAYDLRPLALGEMLDYTFRIYQKVFPFIAVPTALLLGPALFPLYLFSGAAQQFSSLMQKNPKAFDDVSSWAAATTVILEQTGFDLTGTANYGLPELGLFAVATGLYTIFFMMASIITHLITIGIVGQRILGIEPTWDEIGRITMRFGWRGIALTFLQMAVMLVPFVPSVILALLQR
jgi:cell division protein FtsI/penicillin-binding protein 2